MENFPISFFQDTSGDATFYDDLSSKWFSEYEGFILVVNVASSPSLKEAEKFNRMLLRDWEPVMPPRLIVATASKEFSFSHLTYS